MTLRLKKVINEIKAATFGLFLTGMFFLMVFSSIAYFFSSWYYPLRLAQTGEITPIIVESTDIKILSGRNGPYWIMHIAKVEGHVKQFSVLPSLYEDLKEGQQYNAFYSDEILYGIISDEQLNWFECIYYDEVHAPLLGLGVFCGVSFFFLRRTLRLLRDELYEIINKSIDKFDSEEDSLLRNLSIAGAIVPYGIVIIFVYVIGLSCIYTIFSIENGNKHLAGLIGGLSVILMAYAPSALLKTRNILSNVRTIRVIGACIKISLSTIALWRLFLFVKTSEFNKLESVTNLLWSLFKYIIGL
jgi:hypothetical protein